jgi:small subunit ribosomal protein S6e
MIDKLFSYYIACFTMDYKIVVSDPKTGKSYQVEVKDEQAKKIKGKKIGETLEGSLMGLPGYKLQITGGADKAGFPMKTGVHAANAAQILMGNGVGFKAKDGLRKRIRVHGEIVGDMIVQINTKVVEYGGKSLDETFPAKAQEESK